MANNWVSMEWLAQHVQDENIVVADCRFDLADSEQGFTLYVQDHIPEAVYFDLEADLSAPVCEHGGRHPLPDMNLFISKLGQAGIDATKTVIIYDDQGGSMAARLWWMLKYVGHDNVSILEEGYTKWKQQGHPVTPEQIEPDNVEFVAQIRPEMLASVEDVRGVLHAEDTVLIDARAEERYTGANEPLDRIGGHIPGAEHECWQNGLDQSGKWKSKEEQEERLQTYSAQSEKDMIIYCGSGVTACANALAFDEIGLKPKLYVGSWSDWITYPENETVQGKE